MPWEQMHRVDPGQGAVVHSAAVQDRAGAKPVWCSIIDEHPNLGSTSTRPPRTWPDRRSEHGPLVSYAVSHVTSPGRPSGSVPTRPIESVRWCSVPSGPRDERVRHPCGRQRTSIFRAVARQPAWTAGLCRPSRPDSGMSRQSVRPRSVPAALSTVRPSHDPRSQVVKVVSIVGADSPLWPPRSTGGHRFLRAGALDLVDVAVEQDRVRRLGESRGRLERAGSGFARAGHEVERHCDPASSGEGMTARPLSVIGYQR